MQAQKPLCLKANNCLFFESTGRQSCSKMDLSFFKYLNILLDKTKKPPFIYSIGFSLILLTSDVLLIDKIPLGFLYFTAVSVAILFLSK